MRGKTMVRRYRKDALLPKLPLLMTESADEFDALCDKFEREIQPRGIIEQMYVADICSMVSEIFLRQCKTTIINAAFLSSLKDILRRATDSWDEAETLAVQWFNDKEAKTQVSEILSEFHLDESGIEAEAIR